jgi:hypothetical protein
MEAKDILGYLGIDEVNSLDDFKAKLHEKYLPVSDEKAAYDRFVKPALGKHSNVVKQKMLNHARELGAEFTLSEFDELDNLETFKTLTDKVTGKFKSELESLKQKAGANGDDVVKEWQEKFDKAQKRASEEENLRKQLASEFETFKGHAHSQVKDVKRNYLRTDLMSKIKFKPNITELEKEGFNSYISSNYRLDFDDQEKPIVLDASGNRIRSEKKADEWKAPEEVFVEAAKKFNIFAENPQSGKPVPQGVGQPTPQAGQPARTQYQPPAPSGKRRVNPMFDNLL